MYIMFLKDESLYTSSLISKANVHHDLKYWNKTNTVDESIWPRPKGEKYLTFKSWGAGFNNERISLELAFAFAVLYNRTLVLPPKYKHYNLKEFAYEDFFEVEDMKKAIPVLTFKEFQLLEAVNDNFDGIEDKAYVLRWPDMPHSLSVFVYPEKPDRTKEPEKWLNMIKFAGKKREGIIRDIYSEPDAVKAKIIHFPYHQLFCHYYAYIHVTDRALDRYIKRLVRDHVHIRTDIFDAASRILNKLGSDFYTMHIRRGDFQYQNQRYIKGEDIFKNIENLIPDGATLYIATDERNKEVFDALFTSVFKRKWKVVTYDNYSHLVEVPSNWIGLIEQIVCSRGKKFVGTKMSTFSGYITRLRGYMSDISDKEIYFTDTHFPGGYNDKRIFSNVWPTWSGYWVESALWAREFKESWEID